MTVVAQQKPRQAAWAARPKLRISRTSPATAEDSEKRPLTATLEYPLVLNASLLSKLDMTAFTKEGLLAISRLCSLPLVVHGTGRKVKRRTTAGSRVDENKRTTSEMSTGQKIELKEPKRGKKLMSSRRDGVDAVFGGVVSVLEPCRACGRPEQPERLHSHPPATILSVKSISGPSDRGNKTSARTPITKPVPANFKSAEKIRLEKCGGRKGSVKNDEDRTAFVRPRSGRPRTVTCYVCSREFGTASLPLHEPKCIQKWERENQQLPLELRRKLPEKSKEAFGFAEQNDFAWRAAQAALVPCTRCGRTFNPDRLSVHMRSCKESLSTSVATPPESQQVRPRTVPCYICGREFGTRSIAIHEPQCLRKWKLENEALPSALQRPEPKKPEIDLSRVTGCYICGEQMSMRDRIAHERECLHKWKRANSARPEGERLPDPQRPDYRFTENGEVDFNGTWHAIWSNHVESLIPCRQCGRRFFPDRIERHEAVCANLPVKSKTTR